ncbi:MAG: VCBS repeat-containing protein [Verrucomicrobiota bacterium]
MRNPVATLLMLSVFASAVQADLAPPVRLLPADLPHAAPYFSDVDRDGKPDLLVGLFREDPYSGARLQWFRNLGETAQPKWGNGAWLRAGEKPMAVDEFCHTGFGPQMIDFDGDGIEDLVSGSSDCRINVFPGIGTGRFGDGFTITYINDGREQRAFRFNTRIFVDDWDGDGALDLLAARNKSVWWIRNRDGKTGPAYEKPVPVVTIPRPERLFVEAVVVADWNLDGRKDLVTARSDGSLVWYGNRRAKGLPQLNEPETLTGPIGKGFFRVSPTGDFEEPVDPCGRIRFCVADYNGDALPDILVGTAWMKTPRHDAKHPGPAQSPNVGTVENRCKV